MKKFNWTKWLKYFILGLLYALATVLFTGICNEIFHLSTSKIWMMGWLGAVGWFALFYDKFKKL